MVEEAVVEAVEEMADVERKEEEIETEVAAADETIEAVAHEEDQMTMVAALGDQKEDHQTVMVMIKEEVEQRKNTVKDRSLVVYFSGEKIDDN